MEVIGGPRKNQFRGRGKRERVRAGGKLNEGRKGRIEECSGQRTKDERALEP